jgi:PAS domain S-box-containing protein
VTAHKILVVEDNPASRKVARLALAGEGFRVVEAGDGAAALDLVERERPDLIIQDLSLPDIDGYDLVRRFRSLTHAAGVPILAYSGFLSRPEYERTTAAGFTDFLAKPLAPSRLLEAVHHHLKEPMTPPPGKSGRGRRLLLVDDDPVQGKLNRLRLAQLGFHVSFAANGREALEAAQQDPPDIIVSDVLMPGLDGFGLTIELRRLPKLSRVPLILISSHYVEESDLELARKAGAHALVVRSPDLKEAIDTIFNVLDSHLPPPHGAPIGELLGEYHGRLVRQLERQLSMNMTSAYRSSIHAALLSVVAGISESLAQMRDLESSLPEILASLMDATGVSQGALKLRDVGTSAWVHAGLPPSAAARLDELLEASGLLRRAESEGIPASAAASSRASIPIGQLLDELGSGSVLVVPISSRNEKLGVLVLGSRSENLVEPDWIPFGRTMAIQVGQALAVARAFTRVAASERDHRTLFENAGDAIEVVDAEGRIREVNQKAEETLGHSRAEMVGRSWLDFIVAEERPAASAQFRELRSRGRLKAGLLRFVRSDGSSAPMEISGSVVDPDRGTVLLIARNLSDRFEAERKLEESEERYRQAQKLEAVGRLAGGVAHDFNNLLTAILGFSEMTMSQLPDNDPLRSELDEVLKAGHRAASLTRQLLAFSRRQVLQPRLIDLNERVAEIGRMLKRLIGEDVELVTRLAPGLGPLLADPGQIEQILMNLAVNARDAMPQGGRLIIETSESDRPGRWLRLSVTDTGTGMSEEVKAHLFEPFFTTKEVGRGTGLGLATVYGIVEQSGGEISVESELGKGTTFRILFPAVEGELEPKPPESPPPRASGGETVLIVEDEDAVRKLASSVLRGEGYKVLEGANGQDALSVAAGWSGPIDLALTDVVMPIMGGHEFARRLAKARPETRVLYMSGYSDTEIHRLVAAAGIPFLQKPFTRTQLLGKVREIIQAPASG